MGLVSCPDHRNYWPANHALRHVLIVKVMLKDRFGLLVFKTFNPNRRMRFRLKVYKLCASNGPTAVARCTPCRTVMTLIHASGAVVAGFLGLGYQFVDNCTLRKVLSSFAGPWDECGRNSQTKRKFVPKDLNMRSECDVDYQNSKILALQ